MERQKISSVKRLLIRAQCSTRSNGPRDSRTFDTKTGKAMITVNELEALERPVGRLILQTMRSHDQFNTTIYSLGDRYRGNKNGRDVIFVNPEDLIELKLADGQRVDIHSEWKDEPDRVLRNYRVVSYPTAGLMFFGISTVMIPPRVSRPSESGVTSSS